MSEGKKKSGLPKEGAKLGGFPWGAVEDSEDLARIVFLQDPTLLDTKSRRMLKGALETKHLRERDGWSLVRSGCDMSVALEKYAKTHKGSKNDYGYALVNAGEVRRFLDELENRALCIKADPRDWCPAHALARKGRKTIMSDKEIRKELLALFSEVKTK